MSNDEDDIEWPKEVAERVELILRNPEEPQPERECFFRFIKNQRLLTVVSGSSDTEENTIDIIDLNDIVGVIVEIELSSSDISEPRSLTSLNRNDGDSNPLPHNKLLEGQTSPITNDEYNNEPVSEIPVDTQANAILSLFVYPKQNLSTKGYIQTFCGTERNKTKSSNKAISFLEDKDRRQDSSDTSKSSKIIGQRYCHHRRFTVAPSEDLTDLSILVNAIRKLSQPKRLPLTSTTASLDEEERLLVIVNPCSGRKMGVSEYEKTLLPMLEEAGVAHDCLITTHTKHAEERMRKQCTTSDFKDVSEYTGIVVVGGDGTIHEIMQGIHQRDDRDKILKNIKLGMIGAGTSNGFSTSLAYASKENMSPLDSAFMIVKGVSSWIDLSIYETKSSSYTSFLTFSWAMIADIDIESECIRWVGFLRMDIWGILRVLFLRKYRAKFSYLPPTEDKKKVDMPPLSTSLSESDGWVTVEDDFVLFWVSQVTHAGEQMYQSPPCKLNDGIFQIFVVRGNVSRLRLALILLAMEHGGHVGMNGVEFIQCSAYRLEPITQGSYNDLDGEIIESGPIQAAVLPSSIQAYSNPQYT